MNVELRLRQLEALLGISAGVGGSSPALAAKLAAANNLSELTNAGTARTNIGLGTAATQATSAFATPADLAARVPRFLRSGLYHRTIPTTSLSTSATLGIGTLRLSPFDVPRSVTLTRIGAEITSAGDVGSKLRLGIYADDGTGYPGALVLDAGTINGDSATVQEITINQALAAGRYWVGGAVQVVTVTQPTVRILSIATIDAGSASLFTAGQTVYGYAQGSVTGALPSPSFTATVSGAGSAPAVFVKVA